jgi:predicted transposase YdaD
MEIRCFYGQDTRPQELYGPPVCWFDRDRRSYTCFERYSQYRQLVIKNCNFRVHTYKTQSIGNFLQQKSIYIYIYIYIAARVNATNIYHQLQLIILVVIDHAEDMERNTSLISQLIKQIIIYLKYNLDP